VKPRVTPRDPNRDPLTAPSRGVTKIPNRTIHASRVGARTLTQGVRSRTYKEAGARDVSEVTPMSRLEAGIFGSQPPRHRRSDSFSPQGARG
jgi:hypothetical protein